VAEVLETIDCKTVVIAHVDWFAFHRLMGPLISSSWPPQHRPAHSQLIVSAIAIPRAAAKKARLSHGIIVMQTWSASASINDRLAHS
jgi:hypothetical protein